MPFDASGNFTRNYNWVDDRNAGIHIEAVRMDGEFDNYAAALNQTMLRTGLIAMTGDLNMQGNGIYNLEPGSLATPSLRFINDTTTGIASLTTGTVSLITTGAEVLRATVDGVAVDGDFGVTGDIFGDGNLIVNGGAAVAELIVNGAAATNRNLMFQSSGVNRWSLYANAAGEGGSNAGSDFSINSYADDGSPIGVVFSISRASGYISIPGGATITGGLTTDIAVANDWSAVNGAKSTNRLQYFQTAGVSRWAIGGNAIAESGSGNIGTDFQIARFSDTGAYLDSPLSIVRSNGQVAIGTGGLAVAGYIMTNSTLYVNGINTTNRNIVWQTSGASR